MMIPTWFAPILGAFLLGQFGLAVMWAIRADKTQALQQAALDAIKKILERHDPAQMRADIDRNRVDAEAAHARLGQRLDHGDPAIEALEVLVAANKKEADAQHDRTNRRIDEITSEWKAQRNGTSPGH